MSHKVPSIYTFNRQKKDTPAVFSGAGVSFPHPDIKLNRLPWLSDEIADVNQVQDINNPILVDVFRNPTGGAVFTHVIANRY